MRFHSRLLIVVLLLATFVVGMSGIVVISNPMAIGVSASGAAVAALMDCEDMRPAKPCGPTVAHCPSGCTVPGVTLPFAAALPLLVGATGPIRTAATNQGVGINLAPRLPPPRTSYIG